MMMKNVILLLILIVIGFTFYSRPSIVYANNNSISIPIATNKIENIDGNANSDEWKDAYKISFPEARLDGQNVTIYLRYESNNRALDIGFIIPGKSPVPFQSASYEGMHFAFDVTDSKNQYLNSDDHLISLYRDKTVQYSIGHKEKGWIANATTATTSETNLPLQEPFSKVYFKITSASDSWSGESKVYFKSEPTLYRFSILEETNVTSRTGHQVHKAVNFPLSSKLTNPSTWTDIKFANQLGNNTSNEKSPLAPEVILYNPKIDGLKVTMDGKAIPASGVNITKIHFDWGDGKAEDGNFPLSHSYIEPRSYTITVTAYDNNSLSNSSTESILIPKQENDNPELIITNARVDGPTITISGDATSKSGGQITKYHIDWNDGKTNDVRDFPFVHAYDKPGNYIVSIKVYDSNDLTNTRDLPIEIKQSTLLPSETSNNDLISRIFEPSIMAAIITTIGGIIGIIITVRSKSTSKRRRKNSSN